MGLSVSHVLSWTVGTEVTVLFVSLLANEGMFFHINTLEAVSAKWI